LTKILGAKCQNLPPRLSQKIGSAIAVLNFGTSEEKKLLELVRAEVGKIGLSEWARRLSIDVSNLSKVVDGKRTLSRQLAAKFHDYFVLT
jgi:hypothetical protein